MNIHKVLISCFALSLLSLFLSADEERISSPDAVLSMLVTPQQGEKFKFGELTDAEFTLKNLSKTAVLVSEIVPVTNKSEEGIILSSPVYGNVQKVEGEDAFRYFRLSQQETREPFHACMMLPGEEVAVVHTYRPVAREESFEVKYIAGVEEDAETTHPLGKYHIYIPDTSRDPYMGIITYRPYDRARWKFIAARETVVRPPGPENPLRAVLIPDLPSIPDKSFSLQVDFALKRNAFTLESAAETAAKVTGKEAGSLELIYCNALEGYIVNEENYAWLLTDRKQTSRGTLLAHVPSALLKDLDKAGEVKVRVGDKQEGFGPEKRHANWLFWNKYPVFYGDGMYTHGEYISIKAEDLIGYLSAMNEKGKELKVHTYYFRSRYYVIADR